MSNLSVLLNHLFNMDRQDLENDLETCLDSNPTSQLKEAILESLRKAAEEKKNIVPVVFPERRTINHAKELNRKLAELQEENFRLKLKIYFQEEGNKHNSKNTHNDTVNLKVELEEAHQELNKKNSLLEETLQYLAQIEKINEQLKTHNVEQIAHISETHNTSQRLNILEKQIHMKEDELSKNKRQLLFIRNTFNSLMGPMFAAAKRKDWKTFNQLKESFNQVFDEDNDELDRLSNVEKRFEQELASKTEEIKNLQHELEKFNQSESRKATSEEDSSLSSWSADYRNQSSLPKEMELELNTLHKAVQQKDSENRALMAERNDLLNESKCRAETFMNLIEERNAEIFELQSALDKSEKDKESSLKIIQEHQECISSLEKECCALKNQLDLEITEKKRIISEAEVLDQTQVENLAELNNIKKDILKHEATIADLIVKLKEKDQHVTEMNQELASKAKSFDDMVKQVKKAGNEIFKMTNLYEQEKSQLELARKEIFILQRRVSSDAKDDLISSLKTSVEQKENLIVSLKHDMKILREEFYRTQELLKNRDSIVQTLNTNASSYIPITRLSQRKDSLSESISKDVDTVESFGDQCDHVESSFRSVLPVGRKLSSSVASNHKAYPCGSLICAPKRGGDAGCQMEELFVLRKKYKEAAEYIIMLEEKSTKNEELIKDYEVILEKYQKECLISLQSPNRNSLKESTNHSKLQCQTILPAMSLDRDGLDQIEFSLNYLSDFFSDNFSNLGKSNDTVQLKEEISMLVLHVQQLEDKLKLSQTFEAVRAVSSSRLEETGINQNSFWEPSTIMFDNTTGNMQESHFDIFTEARFLDKTHSSMKTARTLWLYIKHLEEFLQKLLCCGDKSDSFLDCSQSIDCLQKLKETLMNYDYTLEQTFREFKEDSPEKSLGQESISLIDFADSVSQMQEEENVLERSKSFMSDKSCHTGNLPHIGEHYDLADDSSEGNNSSRNKSCQAFNPKIQELQIQIQMVEKAMEVLSCDLQAFQNGTSKIIAQFLNRISTLMVGGDRHLDQNDVITAIEAVSSHLNNVDLKVEEICKILCKLQEYLQSLNLSLPDGLISSVSKRPSQISASNQDLEQEEMSLIHALSMDPSKNIKTLISDCLKETQTILKPTIDYLKSVGNLEFDRRTNSLNLTELLQMAESDSKLDEKNESDLLKSLQLWTALSRHFFDIILESLKSKSIELQEYVKKLPLLKLELNVKDEEIKQLQDKYESEKSVSLIVMAELTSVKNSFSELNCEIRNWQQSSFEQFQSFGYSVSKFHSTESLSENQHIDKEILAFRQTIFDFCSYIEQMCRNLGLAHFQKETVEKDLVHQKTLVDKLSVTANELLCQKQSADSEISSLSSQVDQLKSRLDLAFMELNKTNDNVTELISKRDLLQAEAEKSNLQIQELLKENAQLLQDCHDLGETLNQSKKELREKEQIWDAEKIKLNNEFKVKEEKIVNLLTELEMRKNCQLERDEALRCLDDEKRTRATVESTLEKVKQQLDQFIVPVKQFNKTELAEVIHEFQKRLEDSENKKEKLATDLSQYKRRYKEAKECLKFAEKNLKESTLNLAESDTKLNRTEQLEQEVFRLQEELDKVIATNSVLQVELKAYDLLSKQTDALLEGAGKMNNQVVQGFLNEMRMLKAELQRSIKANSQLNHRLANYSKQQLSTVNEKATIPEISTATLSTETINHCVEASALNPEDQSSNLPQDWLSRCWNQKVTTMNSQLTVDGSSSVSMSSSVFGMDKELVSSSESLLHSRVINQLRGLTPAAEKRQSLGTTNLPLNHLDDEPVRDVGAHVKDFPVIASSVSAGSFSSQEDVYMHLGACQRSNYSSPDLGIESDPNHEHAESLSSNASSIETTDKISTAISQQRQITNSNESNRLHGFKKKYTLVKDMRSIPNNGQLKAVARVEDYNLLKKEIDETLAVLEGIKFRVKDRLSTLNIKSPSKSLEYSTLKEVDTGCYKMQVCLKKGSYLVHHFSVTPHHDSTSEVIQLNPVATKVDQGAGTDTLINYLDDCQNCSEFEEKLNQAMNKLAKLERRKIKMDQAITKKLSQTGKVLSQAKGNLLDDAWKAKICPTKPKTTTAQKSLSRP